MILYHGTNLRHFKKIKKEGLKPRGKNKGNWTYGQGQGNEELIYLTTCYAAYYAYASCTKDIDRAVILKIELPDDYEFYPDEEFLSHAIVDSNKDRKYKKMEDINALEYQKHWKESLRYMGTVAVKKIPLKYITAYCEESESLQFTRMCDPVISPLNYRICSESYKWALGRLSFKPLKS